MRLRPFLIALAVYLLCVAILGIQIGHRTDFQQFYALDDTYIHLAIAKNLYLYHSYGIAPHIFSAADSSILWPGLVLLSFYLVGVNTLAPLVLTVLASVVFLFVCGRAFSRGSEFLQTALLLAMVFFVPLTIMPFEGMEHVLQALFCVWFSQMAATSLASRETKTASLCVLAALCTATRYEGLYLVFVACLILLWHRRVVQSVLIGASALVPVVAFGLWSQAHGSHFLPNSLLLKALAPGQLNWFAFAFASNQGVLSRYSWHIGLAEIFAANAALLAIPLRSRAQLISKHTLYLLMFFLGTALLHAEFSRLGWVYRYEAYLIAMGLFALFNGIADLAANYRTPESRVPQFLAHSEYLACLLTLVGIPLIYRATITMAQIPAGAQAVYLQQYQMGHFLSEYYGGQPVAANDIGIIGYLGHPDVLDLFGLSSVDVADLKMQGRYTTTEIDRLARRHKVQIAVAYPNWFTGTRQLPPSWIPVTSWSIPPAEFLGGTSVTFYATEPGSAVALIRNLNEYKAKLPAAIRIKQPG